MVGQEKITYKTINSATDPLAIQFFKLRKEVLGDDLERDYRSGASVIDEQSKFVVALNSKNKVVGGCRIQLAGKGEKDVILAFRMTEIYDCFKPIIPNVKLSDIHRAEVSHIAVTKDYSGRGIATELTRRAVKMAKSRNVDVLFVLPYEKQKQVPQLFANAAGQLGIDTFNFVGDLGDVHLINKSDKEGAHDENKKHLLMCSPNGKFHHRFKAVENKAIDWKQKYKNPRIFLASNIMQHQIDGMVFDWDKVMINPTPAYVEAYSYAISKMVKDGHEPVTVNYHDPVFTKTEEYFEKIFGNAELAKKATELTFEHYQKNKLYLSKTPALEGARETLILLKDKKKPVIVASNNWKWVVEEQFNHLFGDIGLNVHIVGDARKGKEVLMSTDKKNNLKTYEPNPTIEKALNDHKMKISKSVYMVGDTPLTDGAAALATGISYILFGIRDADDIQHLDKDKGFRENIGFVANHNALQAFIKENERHNSTKEFTKNIMGEKKFNKFFGGGMTK